MKAPGSLPPVRVVRTAEEAASLVNDLWGLPYVALDTEYFGHDQERSRVWNGTVLCITLAWRDSAGALRRVFVYTIDEGSENMEILRPWLESPDTQKIGHYVPTDYHALANHLVIPAAFNIDTMVLDFFYDENRENNHGLKECTTDHLGRTRKSYNETFGTLKKRKDGKPYANKQWDTPSLDAVARYEVAIPRRDNERILMTREEQWNHLVNYATNDAWDTFELYEFYRKHMESKPWASDGRNYWWYFENTECPLTEIICKLEREGMHLDLPFLRLMRQRAEADAVEIQQQVIDWIGVPAKPSSDKDMRAFLYGTEPTPVTKGTGRNLRTLFEIPGRGFPVFGYTDGGKVKQEPQPKVDGPTLRKLHYWMTVGEGKDLVTEEDVIGCKALMRLSKVETQLSTFLRGLESKQQNSRVHCTLKQSGPTSGRFASSNPNLQNITTGDKDIYNLRDAFDAPKGYILVVFDWNQLEYRLLGHLTGDPKLIAAFTHNLDLHSATTYKAYPKVTKTIIDKFGAIDIAVVDDNLKAALKYIKEEFDDERKAGKTLNFEVIYGVGPSKLAEQLGIRKDQAKFMIESWFNTYDHVRPWQKKILAQARSRGHVRTLCGRYRHPVMWRINNEDRGVSGEEERSIINAVVQGSARDIVVRGMIKLSQDAEFQETEARLINQVHDELIFQVPVGKAQACLKRGTEVLESLFEKPLRVPFPVSGGIGPSWASAKVLADVGP